MYNKAHNRRDNTDYIVRFLLTAVSQIIIQYLVYIRTFTRVLDWRASEYLFTDERGPWAGEELSRQLARDSQKYLGIRLTARGYQQVAIGIALRKLKRVSCTWEKEDGMDEINENEEGEDEGALADEDEAERALDTFRHIMVR
ncbi:hypothetical protein F5884DRAFT_862875 [Xylogone sp. PMI_703]|nr:hypothetical protein F5884DRAFT_862875 [Xylogone sp. PMI_703]